MQSLESEKWTDFEIKKAAKILHHAEKNKSALVRILDELVHWMIILIVIFGNIIISAFIVFLPLFTNQVFFYLIIIILALAFGFLIDRPLRDIEKLDKNKHFLSRLIIPLLALVNIYIVIGLKNVIEYFSKLNFNFNPIVAGTVYGLFFLLPIFMMGVDYRKKK